MPSNSLFSIIITWFIVILLFIIAYYFLPSGGFVDDIDYFIQWSSTISDHGIGLIYNYTSCDYLPGYHYLLWLFAAFNKTPLFIEQNRDYLKLISFLFDLFIFVFLINYLQKLKLSYLKSVCFSLLYIVNLGIVYNTLIWGQVDSIQCFLIIMATYSAYNKNIILTIIFMTIGLFFKLQVIIFLPFLVIFLLPTIIEKFSLKNITIWLATFFITSIVICLPFIIAGTLDKVWLVITGSFEKYPVVSLFALNHWYWYFDDPTYINDNTLVANLISLKNIGLLLFSGVYFTIFGLLLSISIKCIIKKQHNLLLSFENCMLLLALINFYFYFLNTEMHERYIHPTLVFFAVYVISSRKHFIAYFVLSVLVFLNLEIVLRYFNMHYHTFLFNLVFLSCIYFCLLVYMTFLWLQAYNKARKQCTKSIVLN